tara:strand:- start:334 stop:624 length:291 start_codon:yes stop_codon:yes gene_type:complete
MEVFVSCTNKYSSPVPSLDIAEILSQCINHPMRRAVLGRLHFAAHKRSTQKMNNLEAAGLDPASDLMGSQQSVNSKRSSGFILILIFKNNGLWEVM